MSTKTCEGLFLFYLDPELFAKSWKDLVFGFYTLVFYIFINNSRSRQKKKKKNLEHPFVDIVK